MLTIIVPTIGRMSIERTIHSIDNQTFRTKYIIVADVFGIGAGPTRNQAMSLVKTSWVGFCDDDDYLDEHYHEWLFKERGDADLVIFRMKNSPLIEEAIPSSLDVNDLTYNKVGISFALKTEVARKFPFRYEVPGEDHDLIMRVKKAGYKLKIINHVAYYIGNLKQ